ncbi:hypothetical protein [Candidatus Villigracilis saccharophilus]|uniref:hypothetical protein n=1 Tax=Candidatus Villigracilis saccharophilus TaxID=3140684 RepID=UPI003135BD64|nr:hypothetical protein [Anaerolineales bacterium]
MPGLPFHRTRDERVDLDKIIVVNLLILTDLKSSVLDILGIKTPSAASKHFELRALFVAEIGAKNVVGFKDPLFRIQDHRCIRSTRNGLELGLEMDQHLPYSLFKQYSLA